MSIWLITGLVLFVGILYFLFFHSPVPDKLLTSKSEDEIKNIQQYLENNGIKTYTKNLGIIHNHKPGLSASGLVDPSLHVIEPKDIPRALNLLRQLNIKN